MQNEFSEGSSAQHWESPHITTLASIAIDALEESTNLALHEAFKLREQSGERFTLTTEFNEHS